MIINFIIGKIAFKKETKFPGGFFIKIAFYGKNYYHFKGKMKKLIKESKKLKKQFTEDLEND